MTEKRFRFLDGVEMADVEAALALAALSAEANFGRSQVRLDARFELDGARRTVVCDTSQPVGACIARVLTALLSRSIGEEAFLVDSVDADDGVVGREGG